MFKQRSFFAVYNVHAREEENIVILQQGTTVHGMQQLDMNVRKEPTLYYHRNGPVGQFFKAVRTEIPNLDVGLVGLGLGTVSCYRQPGEQWVIYEIDPTVVEIARDNRFFHFMDQCGKDIPVVIGDARISLQSSDGIQFDALVIDAFSSDSIPIHLITKEALALYMSKINESGYLLMHTSNRHIDLIPILSRLASEEGYHGITQFHDGGGEELIADGPSEWVVLAKKKKSIENIFDLNEWEPLPVSPEHPLWTDDYSNILQVLKF